MCESTARLPLYGIGGAIVAYTLIDATDFERLSMHRWLLHKDGYAWRHEHVPGASRQAKKFHSMLHRDLISAELGQEVDHVNRDKLDNRRCNLRLISRRNNNLNTDLRKNNSTGFRGVVRDKQTGRFKAQIKVNGRYVYLGMHATAEDAAQAYDNAAREHNGQFAMLNFPERSSNP